MARAVTGTAIASVAMVDRERVDRRDNRLPARRANDGGEKGGANVVLIARDVGGLLAAEYRSLITYSRRLTSDGPEAADLVHMVCARVLAQGLSMSEVANPSGWLRTVLFHAFVDLRRRERREIPTDSASLDRPALAPDAETAGPQVTIDDVRALLSAVPPRYRVPYELFTFEEMPYARIAVVLGLPCTTVGTRINRARERLRRLIRARHGG
jgi:RNA polymerase sigma-70 factor, ECF subfamily